MSSKKDNKTREPDGQARRASLAGRLTLWYALSSFILVVLVTGYLYWALARNLDRVNDHFLADQALPLVNLLRDKGTDRKAVRRQIELAWTSRPDPNVYFRVLDSRNQVIADTPGMGLLIPRPDFLDAQAFDRNSVRGRNYDTADDHPFRILAVHTDASPPFIIQVAMDRSQAAEVLADYRFNLALVLGVALLVCSVGSYLIAHRGIKPVKDIAHAAGHIQASTLHERIAAVALPAELRTLADTFNAMLDRLERSFAQVAQFAADIAHELRTPINNLRGEAEVALSKARTAEDYQQLLGSALEEYDRLSRLIESLLFLARAENPACAIHREPIDLGQELQRLAEFYEASAAEGGVGLHVDCPEIVRGQWDRTLLQRALGNLVSNALRHTPPKGNITVSARTQDGGVHIEVADTGAGMEPRHLPRIFERFYRAAGGGQDGHIGLGLAIVKKIAELHGGSVAVASEVAAGTKVTLSLPKNDPASMTKS
jgi:two-component system heavy metal sensor histidine kinase CusS